MGDPRVNQLWLVAYNGNVSEVSSLLSSGVDINGIHSSNGQTALHVASLRGFDSIVSLLLQRGADIHKKDNVIIISPSLELSLSLS